MSYVGVWAWSTALDNNARNKRRFITAALYYVRPLTAEVPKETSMRRLISLAVVAVVASSCAPTVNVEQEKTTIMARDAEWSKTAADIDKFVTFLTPEATIAFGGMPPMKGTQAVKNGLGPLSKSPGFSVSWKADRAEVAASGDL